MSNSKLAQICQNLEIFIALKNQHFLIQAWIELKKINKRVSSFYSSQARSYASSDISAINRRHFKDNSLLNYVNYFSQKNSAANLHANVNLQTDYGDNLKAEMQKTVIKNQFREPQSSIQKRAISYQKAKTFNLLEDERQLQDSDQFQDVVLDRLSKLEENINKIMNQRRQKDQSRGYIGAPINPHTHPRSFRGIGYQHQKAKPLQNTISRVRSPHAYQQANSLGYQFYKSRFAADASIDKSIKFYKSDQQTDQLISRRHDSKVNINKIKQLVKSTYQKEKSRVEDQSYQSQTIKEQQSSKHKYTFQNSTIQAGKYIKIASNRSPDNIRQNYKGNMIISRYQKMKNHQFKISTSPQQIKSSGQISRKPTVSPNAYHGSFKIQKNSANLALYKNYLRAPNEKNVYTVQNVSQSSSQNSKINKFWLNE